MKVSKIILFLLFIYGMDSMEVKAVGAYTDPVRVALIEMFKEKSEKIIKTQGKMQSAMSGGHTWIESQVSEITEFQKQFNDYLDSFHDVLMMSAEVYGIYYEADKTVKNVNLLGKAVKEGPTNALAVAFSTRRNKIYREMIANSIDVVMDLKKLCLDKNKLTEQQKLAIAKGVRPKLNKFNKKLRVLYLAIKYTSFSDVWSEISGRANAYTPRTTKEIAQECMKDWKDNIRYNR